MPAYAEEVLNGSGADACILVTAVTGAQVHRHPLRKLQCDIRQNQQEMERTRRMRRRESRGEWLRSWCVVKAECCALRSNQVMLIRWLLFTDVACRI